MRRGGTQFLEKMVPSIVALIYFVPNLVHTSVPDGKDETENITIKEWGSKPELKFKAKNHMEIGESLGLFD